VKGSRLRRIESCKQKRNDKPTTQQTGKRRKEENKHFKDISKFTRRICSRKTASGDHRSTSKVLLSDVSKGSNTPGPRLSLIYDHTSRLLNTARTTDEQQSLLYNEQNTLDSLKTFCWSGLETNRNLVSILITAPKLAIF